MDARLRQVQARKDREATAAARAAAGDTSVALNNNRSGGTSAAQQQQRRQRQNDDDGGLQKYAADGVFSAEYHAVYKASPWVVVTGLPLTVTEGDLAAVAAQFGSIVDVRLDRTWHRIAEDPNKPRRHPDGTFLSGRGFVAYADPRSCVLVTDNLQGITLEPKNPAAVPDDPYTASGAAPRGPSKLRWDHCLERQVPPMPADVPTYAEWLHAQMGLEAHRIAEIMGARRGAAEAKLALAVPEGDVEV